MAHSAMRTTIDIPDAVYRRLKSRAASEGTSVRKLILRGVEVIIETKPRGRGYRVTLPLIPSDEPGTLNITNEQIYDLLFP
jgi:hypothetical protein